MFYQTFNVGRGDVSSPSPPKKILVEVISKQIRLPDNEVELIASTIPADISGINKFNLKTHLHCYFLAYFVLFK